MSTSAIPSHRRGARTKTLLLLALVLTCCYGAIFVTAIDHVAKLTPAQHRRAVTAVIGHHSFSPPLLRQYYGDGEIPHWMISGSTVVTDNYVRLTADQQSQTGHLWNTEPLDMDSFEVTVGFRAYKQMGGLGADGFALWIAQPPRFDGNLFGRPSNFNGIGILFDSYDNDNRRDNPMVGVITNDGSNTKKFTPETDFMGQYVSSCVFDFRNAIAPSMATARVKYDKGTLSVYLSRDSEIHEQHCFTVPNLPLPKGNVYLALSSQTGGVSETHDIIFVHLTATEGADYDHDVKNPIQSERAAIYNNDAMNARQQATPTTQPPADQQREQEMEARIKAETARRVAELERERIAAQQATQTPTPTSTQDPVAAEEWARIAELEKQLEDLKRRDTARTAMADEEEEEGEDNGVTVAEGVARRQRIRRARTYRGNGVR